MCCWKVTSHVKARSTVCESGRDHRLVRQDGCPPAPASRITEEDSFEETGALVGLRVHLDQLESFSLVHSLSSNYVLHMSTQTIVTYLVGVFVALFIETL